MTENQVKVSILNHLNQNALNRLDRICSRIDLCKRELEEYEIEKSQILDEIEETSEMIQNYLSQTYTNN